MASVNVTKTALLIIILSLISRGTGLLRESILAAYFGASAQSDAYKIASGLPLMLLGFGSTAVTTTFIPVYAGYIKRSKDKEAEYFINNTFNIVAVISVLLTVLGFLSVPVLVRIIVPGFNNELYSLTVKLSVIMLPSLLFYNLSDLSSGYLHSHNRFAITSLTGIPFNLVIIASVLLSFSGGIEIVAAGSLIAVASQFFIQLPSMFKSGYRFKPVLDFREEGIRKISILILPLLISSLLDQAGMLVNKMMASGLDEGTISALDYADKINNIALSILINPVLIVVYPRLSYLADDMDKFKTAIQKALRVILLISLPVMVGLMVMRVPVIRLFFERGAFNSKDTAVTAIALGGLSLGIIGMSVKGLFVKAFYSLKDTKTPVVTEIITICLNIVLNFIFIKLWGVGGLACAASISVITGAVLLLLKLKARIDYFCASRVPAFIFKLAAAGACMALTIFVPGKYLTSGLLNSTAFALRAGGIIINLIAGGCIYALILYWFRIEEITLFINIIKRRLSKGWW